MRKYINKIILITAIAIFIAIARPAKVQAGLQANKDGTSKVSTSASDFFKLIKGMEIGTIGKSSSNAEDGIDCHMAKNTEWGGAAILAACSNFGVVPTANTDNSTTGNESGIYQMAGGTCEYTSHYITSVTGNWLTNIKNADVKYKNEYENSGTRISGDALNIGTISGTWESGMGAGGVIARGNASLFNSIGGSGSYNNPSRGGRASSDSGSRAAIVNGTGL